MVPSHLNAGDRNAKMKINTGIVYNNDPSSDIVCEKKLKWENFGEFGT